MNVLNGKIAAIETNGSLSIIEIQIGSIFFKTILIETPNSASYLKEENEVKVIFKETEVVIGKGTEHAVSLQNKITGTINDIEKGALLSKLRIKTSVGIITSIITTSSVLKLELNVNETVTAMIKTNEIMLSQ